MANPFFKFKKFTVYHDLCAMKVGVDGVLLGAWVPLCNEQLILDVGTGSGLIALMLAQRSSAQIHAVDSDINAVRQSEINFKNSPWMDRLSVYHQTLQQFKPDLQEKYDLIVSNPPFFIKSLKSPESARNMARHTDSLSHEDLLHFSSLLLKKSGRICLILPVDEANQCVRLAEKYMLNCTRKVVVHPRPDKAPKRILLEFSFENRPLTDESLVIETERHEYTAEFAAMAGDFYLKL